MRLVSNNKGVNIGQKVPFCIVLNIVNGIICIKYKNLIK